MADLGALGFHAVLVFCVLSVVWPPFEANSLLPSDFKRFENIFRKAQPFEDVATAHWATKGLQILGKEVPNRQGLCSFLQSKVNPSDLESIFHASSAGKSLENCKLTSSAIEDTLKNALNEETSDAETLYYAAVSHANLDLKVVDSSALMSVLTNAVDGADTVVSASQLWLAAVSVPGDHDLKPFTEAVEDIMQQADETDSTLQFDGGLLVTSLFIQSVFGLAGKAGALPVGITSEHVGKFAELFVQQKYAISVSSSYHLLAALHVLASNEYMSPLVISVQDLSPISEEHPNFKVRGSDLLGNGIEDLDVRIVSASMEEETDHVTNTKLPSSGNSEYEFNFWDTKPASGIYTAVVSARPKSGDSVLIPVKDAKFFIKVVVKVTVGDSDFQIIDKEQSLVAKTISLDYPKTSGEKLEVDHHQKIAMKFTLRDVSTDNVVKAHQTFIRMMHSESKQEIFFVAEANDDNEYKFDLDIGATGEESFGSLSGKYEMALIVGDPVIENPFSWNFGSLHISFAKERPQRQPKEFFKPRPEIHHVFQTPETRPPAMVTSIFTILVLSPILVLLVLWMALGANLRGFFSTGLTGILFSVGLGAILGLLFLFWLSLNMFDTLKYLALLGSLTAIFGQRMLRQISGSKSA